MLDSPASYPTYRCSLHLDDRESTALTDQIGLMRHCFAAEMKRSWLQTHAACILPMCATFILTMGKEEDPLERMLRISAAFKQHSLTEVDWMWPVIGPVYDHHMDKVIRDVIDMPVTWGVVPRAEDWPFSSLKAREAKQAVA